MSDPSLQDELRWCLTGPPLHPNLGLPTFPACDAIAAWAQLPCPLPDSSTLPHRIGRRFETHWRHAVEHLPGWQVLAHDIQLHHGGRTLGAPDLLLAGMGEIWHVELAVKFYLCHPNQTGEHLSDWIGPAARDSLARKCSHLQQRQLPLLHTPQAQQALARLNLPAPTRQAVILRGVLFSNTPHAHAEGRWCFPETFPFSNALPLSRQEWLGATPSAPWGPLPDITHPTQVLDPHGQRWMVVPPGWPHTAEAGSHTQPSSPGGS